MKVYDIVNPVKVHSLENCREIYDEIIKKGLIGKDKEFIKKEIVK